MISCDDVVERVETMDSSTGAYGECAKSACERAWVRKRFRSSQIRF